MNRMRSLLKIKPTPKDIKRFENKIFFGSPDGCWYWTSHLNKDGYGLFNYHNQAIGSHRISFIIYRGTIPNTMQVLHTCDNPMCVNPHHLFLGSHTDNMQDMIKKGRGNKMKWEAHIDAKLTKKDVLMIRSLNGKISQVELAKQFNVTQGSISRIILNKGWKGI